MHVHPFVKVKTYAHAYLGIKREDDGSLAHETRLQLDKEHSIDSHEARITRVTLPTQ